MAGNPNWTKGRSGNPAGRPTNTESVAHQLRKLLGQKRAGRTRAEHVAEAWISAAESGDVVAIKTLVDRVDGKVQERIDHTNDGQAFTFTIQARPGGE